MSNLQRSFAKSKLSSLPFDPPFPWTTSSDLPDLPPDGDDNDNSNGNTTESANTNDDASGEIEDTDALGPLRETSAEADDSSSSASSSSAASGGTIRPAPSRQLFARAKG